MNITVNSRECPDAVKKYLDDGWEVVDCKVRGEGRILGYEGDGSPLHAEYFYDLEMKRKTNTVIEARHSGK